MIQKKPDFIILPKLKCIKILFGFLLLVTLVPLYGIFTWHGNAVSYLKRPLEPLFQKNDCSTKLYVFGVTYEPNHERARVAEKTWVKILKPEGITWYSNQTDPLLKTKVIIPKEGMAYANVFWRMRLIWEDVLRNNPGYDWYMRVWDDNYVRWDRLCPLLKVYNANAKLELGHIYTGHVRDEFMPDMDHMIGGGATSLSTKSSNEDLLSYMDKCVAWVQELPAFTFKNNTCRWRCEDYYLSYCRLRLGTRLVDVPGFFSHSPSKSAWSDRDLACGFKLSDMEHLGGSNPFFAAPITLHYVTAQEMEHIHNVFISAQNDSSLRAYNCK